MHHLLSPNREMIQKNGSIRKGDGYNEMLNRYQSPRIHSMPPRGMQQRPQNYPHPINFMQGIIDYKFINY